MEQELRIPIPGTQLGIYGTFEEQPGASLVVFCHGLTCSRNEPVILNGSHLLHDHGFSTFRFDFYNEANDARKFIDNTVDDNVVDLDTVLAHFRAQDPERKIAVAVHSLGGLAAMASETKSYDALVLLDSSHGDFWSGEKEAAMNGEFKDDWTEWDEALQLYRIGGATKTLASPHLMVSRMRDSDADATTVTQPTLILVAKDGSLGEAGQRYLKHLASPVKELREIDSDHSFYSKRPMPDMFTGIAEWLRTNL